MTAAAGDFRVFVRAAAVSSILAVLPACLAAVSAASCFVAFFMFFFAIGFPFGCPYPSIGAWNDINQRTGVKNGVAILALPMDSVVGAPELHRASTGRLAFLTASFRCPSDQLMRPSTFEEQKI